MKALVVNGPNEIQYIDVEKPKVGPRDVLVRIIYSGICGTDLDILGGNMKLVKEGYIQYPVRIGHEWSGIVEEIGEEVKNVNLGDRVIGDNGVSCGICSHCLEGKYALCENIRSVGTVNCWDGSFAEYIIMPHWHIYKLPDNITLEEAALLEPASIALAGIKQINITPDSKVLVIGTGPIGLSAVALAKYKEAGKVILCGRKDYKLTIGKTMGADVLVNATREDLLAVVSNETGGKGVDVVIETSGNVDTVHKCLEGAAPKGVISLISFYEKDVYGFDINRIVTSGLQIRGILGEYGLVKEMMDIMETGAFTLKPLITHRFKFDEAIEVFRTAQHKNEKRIKMLVEIASEF